MKIDNIYVQLFEMDSYIREYLIHHLGKMFSSGQYYIEFSPSMTEYKYIYQWLDKNYTPKETTYDPQKHLYIALPLKADKHPRDGWNAIGEVAQKSLIKYLKTTLEVAMIQDFKTSFSINPNMEIKDFLECWAEKNGILSDKGYYAINKKLSRFRKIWKEQGVKL